MKTYISIYAAAILFHQLAAAERQRLPLHEVLDIINQDQDLFGQDRAAVQLLARLLREGQPLSAALMQLPELVKPETAALIQVAERNGRLAATLEEIAEDYANRGQGRRTLYSTMSWPIVMAIGISLLLSMMMIFVVPAFKDVFQGFGTELPVLTQLMIWVSDAIANYWWLFLLAGLLLFIAWWRDLVPIQVGRRLEQLWLAIPFVRPYFVRRFVTRIVRWVKLGLNDQELLLASLRHVHATERIHAFCTCAAALESRLLQGKSLSAALTELPPLPLRLSLFLQLSEKLGNSDALDQVIAMSEQETADALSRFERGLTISTYMAFGILVGMIVIAIYLPIFKMGSIL